MHIRIGTRASKLALTQTHWIVQRLHQQWPSLDIEIEHIRTTGDQITNLSLAQIGSDGVFVSEIEQALTQKRIDLAVHSLKDLPTVQPPGLSVVVVGPREDVRDVLVSRRELGIPWKDADGMMADAGAVGTVPCACPAATARHPLNASRKQNLASLRIGTCSLRRTAQIRARSQNVEILPLRGNVDTRLRKLEAGDYDGIVLAAAGLRRLYTEHALKERFGDYIQYLPIEMMMPAPGQGAVALECREEPEILALLAPLQDHSLQAACSAERMFMRYLGAGCYLPVAAYGTVAHDMLTLRGLVISLDGQQQVRVEQSMVWTQTSTIGEAEHLGEMLAERAIREGANEIIRSSVRPSLAVGI